MGKVSVYKCEMCKKIISDDGWLLHGALSQINGKLAFGSGPKEEGPLSFCKECLAERLDSRLSNFYNPPYERGGPGDR